MIPPSHGDGRLDSAAAGSRPGGAAANSRPVASERRAGGAGLDAAILCGGLGTRLRPAFSALPKALAPVAGRPFLERLVNALAVAGVSRAVLCTGAGAAHIERFAAGAWPLELLCSTEPRPLGTGGALGWARPRLRTDPALVLNGDSLIPGFDFTDFLRAFQASGAAGMLAVVAADQRQDTGVVSLDASGRLRAFSEKSGEVTRGHHNAGIYLLTGALLDALAASPGVASSLERDWLPRWLELGLHAYVHPGPLVDIGTPERWRQAQEQLRAGSSLC